MYQLYLGTGQPRRAAMSAIYLAAHSMERGDGAEEAFRRAHELGGDPQPGLALLLLTKGAVDVAAVSIRTALAVQPPDRLARARLEAAQVEIALAPG